MRPAPFDRALARSAALAGASLSVERHRRAAWHSATFAGERHELVASSPSGESLDRWLEQVTTHDLAMPGHLLADLKLAQCDRAGAVTHLRIEGLTVATG